MKHLLNGVAIAAALAIAAPVWAQAPASPSAPKAAAPMAAAPMAGAPMAPMAGKQRHKRMMRHMAKRGPAESTTDQLNRQELTRVQGPGAAGMAPAPVPSSTAPASMGGPKQP
jgi:hypothetical protein